MWAAPTPRELIARTGTQHHRRRLFRKYVLTSVRRSPHCSMLCTWGQLLTPWKRPLSLPPTRPRSTCARYVRTRKGLHSIAYTAVLFVQAYARHFREGDIPLHKESQRRWIADKGPAVECNLGFVESCRPSPHSTTITLPPRPKWGMATTVFNPSSLSPPCLQFLKTVTPWVCVGSGRASLLRSTRPCLPASHRLWMLQSSSS